jgi:PEP-CTERM motif-containing protein
MQRRGLLGAISAVGVAWAIALAPSSAPAVSVGFGIESGVARQSGSAQELALQELSDLGTLTLPDAEGVAYWSLDQPVSIFDNGQAIALIDSWDVALKEDPFVQNNVNVTNTSAYTQVFIVSVLMPIPDFYYDKVIYSSVGVSATDNDANNALLVNVAGANFYQGRVDTVTKLALDPPGMPIDTADCSPFPNSPGCTATASAGVVLLPVTPGVAHEIQIILRFALSSGDSAGVTSRFEIASSAAPVPEPSTASLLAIGVALLASWRRRP